MLAQTLQTREEESQAAVKAANEAQAAYEQIKERYEAVIHAKQGIRGGKRAGDRGRKSM